MAIKRLGAQRFAGLAADVASLPIDPDLVGAIFDATDTIQKFVFDGSIWQEFVSGTGEDNTGANVGVGSGTIFRNKIGVVLNFKSLIGGDNITVTDNADDVTITSTGTSPLTTKGDLYGFNTVDDRVPVGTDGQLLSANSANPIGVEWVTIAENTTPTFDDVRFDRQGSISDPVGDQSREGLIQIDVNNDAKVINMKIDGTFQQVRFF